MFTALAEVVENGNHSIIQSAAVTALDWSCKNKLQLNADKCKDMVIDFKKQKRSFDPISLDRKELDTVNNVKILGLTISNNLPWNDHINNTVKKTNKRLYFIILLNRAQVPLKDIIMFYCTCIRPVLEYCTPVFNHALPKYLSEDLERVQKRVLSTDCISRRDVPTKPRDLSN